MKNDEATMDNILKMGLENDPNYDEIMNSFRVSCPVKKINIDVQSPGGIIGMALITNPNIIEILKDKADLDDLQDNTILFFTNQHIVELTNIINGILELLKLNNKITNDESDIHNTILKFIALLHNPIDYKTYKNRLHDFITSVYFKNYNTFLEISEFIIKILELLPFLSYHELDLIAEESISEFKDQIDELLSNVENNDDK